MAKKAKVELVGIEDMEKILNRLPATFQKRVIRAALKDAGEPLLVAAKQSLASTGYSGMHQRKQRTSQELLDVVVQRPRTIKGIPATEIGAMPTKRARRRSSVWEDMGAYWLHWGTMEFMTKPREPGTRSLAQAKRRTPPHLGRVPATGWLIKAVDETEGELTDGFRNILWKQLNKKLLAKAKKIKWSGLQ